MQNLAAHARAPYLFLAAGLLGACSSSGRQPADAVSVDGSVIGGPVCPADWPSWNGGAPDWIECDGAGEGIWLCGAPLAFAPTATGFQLSVALASGAPSDLAARARPVGTQAWGAPVIAEVKAVDTAHFTFTGLAAATRYEYEVLDPDGTPLAAGSTITQRPAGQSFTFALITDTHIGSNPTYDNQGNWCTLAKIAAQAGAASPDFIINLGDMLDFHDFGFNEPPPAASYSRLAYLHYRRSLGASLGMTSHFATVGNWEGEDGFYSEDEIGLSRGQRMLYVPGPSPTTYPQSGSPAQDYYAFTWGDALFVILNVMSYTPTKHLLSYDPGLADDWTLGETQTSWLATTLAQATSRWKFVLIHHPVGGDAADDLNSAYGRGGGRAAYVGEQAALHQWMLDYGVQVFFYGHDHVFTDMVVDGIHYTEPGSAGAIWLFDSSTTGYETSWQESGWGRVTVGPANVDVQFLSVDGEELYAYRL
jgi:hypothetical protein